MFVIIGGYYRSLYFLLYSPLFGFQMTWKFNDFLNTIKCPNNIADKGKPVG